MQVTNQELRDEEAVRFLERDFNQSFDQLRHYDSQIIGIFKFSFTSYATIIGAAIGLYQFGREKSIDLSATVNCLVAIGFLVGSFMLWLMVRNRIYFVRVARYINEHRNFFLSRQPLGFENVSGMYTDSSSPKFFQWKSSQLMFVYISSVLNSALLNALIYMQFKSCPYIWPIIILLFLLFFSLQIFLSVKYLKSEGTGN